MQVGDDFAKFRQQFVENRSREAAAKYVVLSERAEPQAVGEISEFILKELAKDYPKYFSLQIEQGSQILEARLTGERLEINAATN